MKLPVFLRDWAEIGSAQTYVGDILIAVNPYKRIPLYGPEVFHHVFLAEIVC